MIYFGFCLIFVLSLTGGWTIGRFMELSTFGMIASLAVSGFIGSGLVALIFTFLYFFQEETDKEKIQRLQNEIRHLKQTRQTKRIGQ